MAAGTVRKAFEGILVCVVLGAASYWGTHWVLQFFDGGRVLSLEEVAAVDLGESIRSEPNDFVADVRAAARFARERWSYAEYRRERDGLDLDELEAEALALLGDAPDKSEFRLAMLHFAGGLRDGHAGVLFTVELMVPTMRWPFSVLEVREGLMVDGVLHGLEGVTRGDLLIAVDDRPVERWIEAAENFVCASSPAARRREAIRHLMMFDGLLFGAAPIEGTGQRRFRFRRVDDREIEFELACVPTYQSIPEPAARPTTRAHGILEGGVGYFRPGTFSPPPDRGWEQSLPEQRDEILAETYTEFDAILARFVDAPAVVLDLRGNPGGTDLLGQFLTDRFLDDGYVYFQLASQSSRGWRSPLAATSSAPPGRTRLRQPLAVLIDPATFSTADNVAACLDQNHPDVLFVGRPNGAGTGAPRPFTLPRTGTQIYFCTQRVYGPDGTITEGRPVEPDVPVEWTRADLLGDRDPDLAAALDRR